jgi:hypothetical protein
MTEFLYQFNKPATMSDLYAAAALAASKQNVVALKASPDACSSASTPPLSCSPNDEEDGFAQHSEEENDQAMETLQHSVDSQLNESLRELAQFGGSDVAIANGDHVKRPMNAFMVRDCSYK